jgi:signal transduction histidine kinase
MDRPALNLTSRQTMPRPGPAGSAARPRLEWGRASPGWILTLIVVVALLDAATPAGIVVGELFCLPILLAAMADERRAVIATGVVSMIGFAAAAAMGAAPISPMEVWLPNRVIAALSLPAAMAVAIMLQRARLAAERGEKAALGARDLTRLLMSLLAHDLRAPLAVARDCLGYVEGALGTGEKIDERLLGDTVARLDRSLHAIGVVLSLPLREGGEEEGPRPVDVRQELERVASTFLREADGRGKHIVLRLEGVPDAPVPVHRLVLRQVTGILLDNAVRYASPGEIVVAARADARELVVRVEDAGFPAPGAAAAAEPQGLGLGLQLSRALAGQAGGSLTVEDGGSGYRCELRLPFVTIPELSADGRTV